MTTLTTLLDVAQEIAARTDIAQFYTADAVGTTYTQSNRLWGNNQLGTDERAGYYNWRYYQTGADRVKVLGYLDPSNAQISIQSIDNYVNTADKAAAIMGLDPDILLAAITRGHARRSSRTEQPFITFTDADMRRTDANYWNGTSGSSATSNCTATKITTDAFEGPSCLQQVFSAAGFDRGPKMTVYPGQVIWTAVRLKPSASTVTFNLWDGDNLALITNASSGIPTYSGRDWGVMWRQDIVPANCNSVQVQINCAAAATVLVDSFYGPYIFGRKRFVLPVDLDEDWRVRLVRRTQYQTLPNVPNVWDAWSRDLVGDLKPPMPGGSLVSDFTFEINRQDVQPYSINFAEPIEYYLTGKRARGGYGWGVGGAQGPLDLATERYVSNSETFVVPSDTTVLGQDEIVDFSMHELSKMMTRFYAQNDKGWADLLVEYTSKTAWQNVIRPPQAPVQPTRYVRTAV